MASTYVQISREELERWLDKLPLRGQWKLQQGRAGVYLLPLSPNVAVKLSSTIGTKDEAVGLGGASMQLALVSLVTGQVLNKKAQGQDHFKRTTGWETTWRKGFDRIREAYMKSEGFYESIAVIKDRDQYKRDKLQEIETFNGWQNQSVLHDFHRRVQEGGILSTLQEALLQKILHGSGRRAPDPSPPTVPAPTSNEHPMLGRLRQLYDEAEKNGDKWLMEFAESIARQLKAGRSLSPRQQEVLDRNLTKYRLASQLADRWMRSLLG